MIEITQEDFEAFVKKEFPGQKYKWEYDGKSGYFYVQAGTCLGENLHYEFYEGKVHLHIEGPNWREMRDYLWNHVTDGRVSDRHWGRYGCDWVLDTEPKTWEEVKEGFCIIQSVFKPLILDFERRESKVTFETKSFYEILHLDLNIPEYQRIYCWGDEQVITLLDDILNIKTSRYYLGNIILHTNNGKLDIVDGQQRLVTLAILAYKLEQEILGLLGCKYESSEAQSNIFRNARVIDNYLESHDAKALAANIEKLSFGVLTIDSQHLDLAFTFFNNTNSRGKPLTDYDLLKPHHLRYIPSDYESQQELLAKQWDGMINRSKSLADNPEKPELRRDADYIHVLELYLYRLRKWSRHCNCDEFDRYIYSEYKSAPIIEEIPPFGEKFNYYEPIQGGQHFFEYVEHFMQKYREFAMMHEVDKDGNRIDNVMDILCGIFTGYTDKWYRYVMEALIFCYYLKFGNSFIYEATLSIVRYIAQIRFEKGRAYEPTIINYANDSGIALMIEQATSPTFFLAEMENAVKGLKRIDDIEENSVRDSFLKKCQSVSSNLSEHCISKTFAHKKNANDINFYFKTRYGSITTK